MFIVSEFIAIFISFNCEIISYIFSAVQNSETMRMPDFRLT